MLQFQRQAKVLTNLINIMTGDKKAIVKRYGWDDSVKSYKKRWITMNEKLLEKGLNLVPENKEVQRVHVPGVGPGPELQFLNKRFPNADIVSSDISINMVSDATENHNNGRNYFVNCDICAIPFCNIDLSVSFFTVHLVRNPFEAIKSQWESLSSGGKLFALYFPPTPLGENGPLVSIHRAARSLRPAKDSDREKRSISFLEDNNAKDAKIDHIFSSWEFLSLGDFRSSMEVLPQFATLPQRAGVDFYEKMWKLCFEDSGLERLADGFSGPVGASILRAEKP